MYRLVWTLFCLEFVTKLCAGEFWKQVEYPEPVTMLYARNLSLESYVSCVVSCSPHNSSLMVTIQNDRCYCLTSYFPQNLHEGEITISTVIFMFTDEADCRSKNFKIYPELKICLKVLRKFKSWAESKLHCNQEGAYLVNLDSTNKSEILRKYASDLDGKTSQLWIGGYDIWKYGNGSGFRWTRGTFGNVNDIWRLYEPNNLDDDYCMGMWENGGAIDNGCQLKSYFVCEKLLI